MAHATVPNGDNAQWIKTNLIDSDTIHSEAVERLAGQWVNHGMPHDGKLRDAAASIVNQALTTHMRQWPADAQTFAPQEINRAVDLVVEDIIAQAQFLQQHDERVATQPQQEQHVEIQHAIPDVPQQSQTEVLTQSAQSHEQQTEVGKRAPWPRVNFPNGFVHPFQRTGKDGRTWEMMRVSIPHGVTLHGIDLSGWQIDRFMDDRAKADKLNGRPVTVSFKPNTPVELWRGAGETRQTLTINNPWDLCKAVKTQRDAYAAAKAAERESQQQPQHKTQHQSQSGAPSQQTSKSDRTESTASPDPVDAPDPSRGEFEGDGIPRTFGGYMYEPVSGDPVTMHDPYADTHNPHSKTDVLDTIRQRAEQRTSNQPSTATPIQTHSKTR